MNSIRFPLIKFLIAQAGVQAVFGNRIYPGSNSGALTYPFALVHEVSNGFTNGLAGRIKLRETRMQIDTMGRTWAEAEAGDAAIRTALEDHPEAFDGVKVYSVLFTDAGDVFGDEQFQQDIFGKFTEYLIHWEG